ncbi:hypothetical protein [Methylomicrobium lacus]|uniref:hypothetical protein n=1 Tax=Methylomicrobium lacus TaxID=136992 RepID=UPI0004B6AE3E
MIKNLTLILTVTAALTGAPHVNAGTLSAVKWATAGCGNKPETPIIDQSNAEAFNKSVAKINDWQQQAKTYYECLINEANQDNAIIADSANAAQAEYRATVEKIGKDADAAKKKLDSQ